MAWEQVLLGNSDTTTGADDSPVEWLRSPLNLDADQEVVKAALAYGVSEAGTDIAGGVAVWEDGQGFVYCETYQTRAEFDKALGDAEEAEQQRVEEDE